MPVYRSFRFSRLGWRGQLGLVLAIALGLAAAAALVVVSIGVALILLPIVAVALFIGRWRLRKMMGDAQKRWQEQQQKRSGYIDTDYVVLDKEDDRRRR
jgi:membrane protein implicated in regulation of membrane protease activity